jgi:hypothetical protein
MLPVEPRLPAKVHYKYTTETNFVAMDMVDNASALPTCPQRNNKRRQRFKNRPKSPTRLPEEAENDWKPVASADPPKTAA